MDPYQYGYQSVYNEYITPSINIIVGSTAGYVLYADINNTIQSSTTGVTQLSYINNVTSDVQGQLNTLGEGVSACAAGITAIVVELDNFVLKTGDTMEGTLTTQALIPVTNDTYDIGTATQQYKTIHTQGIYNGNGVVMLNDPFNPLGAQCNGPMYLTDSCYTDLAEGKVLATINGIMTGTSTGVTVLSYINNVTSDIQAQINGITFNGSAYVQKAGDTMTGDLNINGLIATHTSSNIINIGKNATKTILTGSAFYPNTNSGTDIGTTSNYFNNNYSNYLYSSVIYPYGQIANSSYVGTSAYPFAYVYSRYSICEQLQCNMSTGSAQIVYYGGTAVYIMNPTYILTSLDLQSLYNYGINIGVSSHAVNNVLCNNVNSNTIVGSTVTCTNLSSSTYNGNLNIVSGEIAFSGTISKTLDTSSLGNGHPYLDNYLNCCFNSTTLSSTNSWNIKDALGNSCLKVYPATGTSSPTTLMQIQPSSGLSLNSLVINDSNGNAITTFSNINRSLQMGSHAPIILGTGSNYNYMQLTGGNSIGYIYSSFSALGDGIAMSYNYYNDYTGTGYIPNTAGGTSLIQVSYNNIYFKIGGINTAPSNVVFINQNGILPNGTNSQYCGLYPNAWKDCQSYAYTNPSDRRLKDNIKYDNIQGMDFLKKIKIASFNYKDEPNKKRHGVVAQEVPEEFAGLWKPEKEEDMYGIDYTQFVPILIKAVQQQQTQIDEMRSQINMLTNTINKLISKS
jgi:hypothetical protein